MISSDTIPHERAPEVKGSRLNIKVEDGKFWDPTGRQLFLRGINLGGSTKVPFSPKLPSHVRENFFNGKDISFVGRPFPLEEADQHFQRLQSWGFHFVRFLVTWEAIEHQGPGIYDQEYLDYLRAVVQKAGIYGINVMIDPHQDVWSRFTGGDGAPLWTLELAGFEVRNLGETGSALVHNLHGDPFPQMGWYTNYYKLGAATMFSLFWGGNDFAPQLKVEGVPIQDFLQSHYIKALAQVAKTLKDLPNVVGFELMNEPSAGYIGTLDLSLPFDTEIIGDAPTPFQSMLLGAGFSQEVQSYKLGAMALKQLKPRPLNPKGISTWTSTGIWENHGVWQRSSDSTPQLVRPDHFRQVKGKPIDFNEQYYLPFAVKYAEAILAENPNWFICVDEVLFPYPHPLPNLKAHPEIKWVNGSHWYDDVTLVKKKYLPFVGLKDRKVVLGRKKVRKAFSETLSEIKAHTKEHYGNAPTLLGEFGIPFDMHGKKAYRTRKYNRQVKALDRCFQAIESNCLNYTLWNYTADNNHERGDQWNGEDLSIYSSSDPELYTGLNRGGRALEASIRPYPKRLTGDLLSYVYSPDDGTLSISFDHSLGDSLPTEIFLPEFVYGDDFQVRCDDGKVSFDPENRLLLVYPSHPGTFRLEVFTGKVKK